jgi:hypothetical protein
MQNGTGAPVLVLKDRLEGHDTFLSGNLELDGALIPVRILTFDDVTVLHPTGKPFEFNGTDWSGHLHLPHGLRKQPAPPDLEQAAAEQGRALAALDKAELRYAVTFLTEATTPHIRSARIDVIVSALPMTSGGVL